MTNAPWPGRTVVRVQKNCFRERDRLGVSLIELLCVIAIIGILASLLVPAVMRAYLRIKGQADEAEAPVIAGMIQEKALNYCAANAQYHFDSKSDFSRKCDLMPKCQKWVDASRTTFVPFTHLDSTNLVVMTVYIGPKYRTQYTFTKGSLSVRPEPR